MKAQHFLAIDISYKKTNRQYYEYYKLTDEWPDENYQWASGYNKGEKSTTSNQTKAAKEVFCKKGILRNL